MTGALTLLMLSQVSNAISVSDMTDSVVEASKAFLHQFAEWYSRATSDAIFQIGGKAFSVMDLVWVVAVMLTAAVLSSVLRRFLNNLPVKHFGRVRYRDTLFAA